MKLIDEMVLADNREPKRLERVTKLVNKLNGQLAQVDGDKVTDFVNADCMILAPEGGIYDSNVQRLLARSGCLNYDDKVRSVYYVGLKLP